MIDARTCAAVVESGLAEPTRTIGAPGVVTVTVALAAVPDTPALMPVTVYLVVVVGVSVQVAVVTPAQVPPVQL